VLGPLEPEAACELALVPMQRLGVTYADPALPEQIAERTGGYPSFIQMLCDAALEALREEGSGDLTISTAHLARATDQAQAELREIFRMNAGRDAQHLTRKLIARESFTHTEAVHVLASASHRAAPPEVTEGALLELRLLGLVVERHGRFFWAIPLLRDALLAADAPSSASAPEALGGAA